MLSLAETTTFNSASQVCASARGYLWYICSFTTTPWYAGCCNIDPCQQEPVGCPPTAQGELVTSLISTSLSAPSETPAAITTSPDIPSQITPSTSISPTGQKDSHGMTISINALVGVVVGCAIAVIFVSLVICMWWSRRRRERVEKLDQAQRLASPRLVDDELVPPGLEGVFNPMASDGPGSIFDRAEGRMSKISHESGSFPNLPLRDSGMSSGVHNKLAVSPLSTNTPETSEGPTRSVELDSALIYELPDSAQPKHEELMSRQPPNSPELAEGPRATLNSTQQERDSNTYVNSWAKFQNVQR